LDKTVLKEEALSFEEGGHLFSVGENTLLHVNANLSEAKTPSILVSPLASPGTSFAEMRGSRRIHPINKRESISKDAEMSP